MKREIKFRAWMDYGEGHRYLLYDRGDLSEFFEAANGCPLMQYTGLNDKNGVEIYEGDVFRTSTGKCEIVFEAGCFHLKQHLLRSPLSFYAESDAGWVIGNIHSNPELL